MIVNIVTSHKFCAQLSKQGLLINYTEYYNAVCI